MSSRTRTVPSAATRVLVENAAQQTVEREIARAGRNETGGLLLGWFRRDLGLAVIGHATGPGRDAQQEPARLVLDTANLQQEVERQFVETNGQISYIGDWHLHHAARPSPSQTDIASLADIASHPEINVPNPILVIVGRARTGRLAWGAWKGAGGERCKIVFVGKAHLAM